MRLSTTKAAPAALTYLILAVRQAVEGQEAEFDCRSLGLKGECEEVTGCICMCYQLRKSSTIVEAAYFGELGYELVLYSPHVHYLQSIGKLGRTLGPLGSSAFNYFSPNHTEMPFSRKWCPGIYRNKDAHAAITDFSFSEWAPPDYKGHFRKRLPAFSDKPLLILHNKFNEEWGEPPANFIDVETLLKLIDMLKPHYTIIYIRPHVSQHLHGYVGDLNADLEFNDHEEIKSVHPEVVFAHELLERFSEMNDFNELQLALHAQAEAFISVLGGNAVISSYFAGTNIIYAVKGQEVTHDDEYGALYPKLSPGGKGKILHARNYDELLSMAQESFLDSRKSGNSGHALSQAFLKIKGRFQNMHRNHH